jgi:tetratricopeptide (TPR) repeat protein
VGADASAIRARAAEALEQASARAASLGAPSEASRYLVRAGELLDDELRRGDLELRAGELAVRAGTRDVARALLDAAGARFAAAGDGARQGRIAALHAQLDRSGGAYSAALERLEAALDLVDVDGADLPTLAQVLAHLGATHALMGDPETANRHLERALQIAEEQELDEIFVRALISRGIVAQRRGRLREAELLLVAAAEHADRIGNVESWLRADNNLAVVYEMTDQFELSLERGQEALRRCRRIGDRVWEAMSLTGELLPMVLLGRWDEALERFEVSAEIGAASGALTETMLLDIVEPLVARGAVEEAQSLVARFAAGELSDDPQSQGGWWIARARVAVALGDSATAREAAAEALVAGRRVGVVGTGFKLALEVALESALAAGEMDDLPPLLAELDAVPR